MNYLNFNLATAVELMSYYLDRSCLELRKGFKPEDKSTDGKEWGPIEIWIINTLSKDKGESRFRGNTLNPW